MATIAERLRGTDGVDRQRVLEVFVRQQAHRWEMAATTAPERVARLKRLKTAILARQQALRDAMHADFGKPPAEVDLTELQPVLGEINHTMRHLGKWMKATPVARPLTLIGTRSAVRYEPRGVVLILSPWNYPFNLLLSPLVAAVAAGCCAIVRPSDKVRRTSRLIHEVLDDVFPEEEVAVFTGPSTVANALLELPFDHVLFTGSTRVGKQVMSAASAHLASVTLELGGQSPVIVHESADLAAAAERVVWGKLLNAGQTCVAPNHVFVPERLVGDFVARAKAAIEKRYGATEQARRASPDLARIVDEAGARRLGALIDGSVAAGARLEIGGVHDAASRYVAPTILSGVTDGSPAMGEEIFGPVLPVLAYRDIGEVFSSIRGRGKPLALYLFSRDKRFTEQVLAGTSAGGTVVNNVVIHLGNPNLPFGGVGASGFGNYHGPYGFRAFSHERAVLVQGPLSPLGLFFPPYGTRVRRLLGVLTHWLS